MDKGYLMPHTFSAEYELSKLSLPPRSRLYSLEPIGVGTGRVESLRSYIVRLARAHHVLPKTLISMEIAPVIQQLNLLPQRPHMYVQGTAYALSPRGSAQYVAACVQALEQLTLRSDLRYLTMLGPWGTLLSGHALSRAALAWCPCCLDVWQDTGAPYYEPLIWSLVGVTLCTIHGMPLATECPHEDCRRAQPGLDKAELHGHCEYCTRWLGALAAGNGSPLPTHSERPEVHTRAILGGADEEPSNLTPGQSFADDTHLWQHWVAHNVEELLVAAALLGVRDHTETLARTLKAYLDERGGESLLALSTCSGVSLRMLGDLQRGSRPPHLNVLLLLGYTLGMSALRLLVGDEFALRLAARTPQSATWSAFPLKPQGARVTIGGRRGNPNATHPLREVPQAALTHQQERRPLDYQKLLRALEAALHELPPPSVRTIEQRLGYADGVCRFNFRDLSTAVSERRAKFVQAMREASTMRAEAYQEELVADVRQATLKVSAEGLYPSTWRVRAAMTHPVSMRTEIVRAARQQTLRELGWELDSD